MALLMTVFFENGFSENYFPNVDNRNFPIAIRPYVSGLKEELVLNAEVWDGQWKLRRSPQYSLILKGDPVESADLKDGTVIEGMVTKTDLYFSVKIDQVQREHVNFEKYMLKEGSIFKLEIGSDDLCNIVYKNRFVTGTHAEITFESGAAYITDKTGLIVARSILFTDVTDQDGKKWRLLERQYSSEGDDVLKRLLVDKLIQEDYIDGYKVIGASCHDANSFVDVCGNSLSDRKFEIDCELELEDTLSYQDSFKWYSYNQNKAYNYENSGTSYNLDTTDLNLYGDDDEDDGEWDAYHQYYCDDTRLCYRNGREIRVDVENLDDFIWIESTQEYHHENDCVCCDECGTYILLDDAMCSEVTEEYYCCKDCMEKAENEFKRENWHYSEYDDEWYEDYTDITRINIWNEPEGIYENKSIGTDTLCRLLRNEEAWEFDNEVFDKVNPSTNLPYGYKLKKEINHEYTIIEAAV